MAAAAAITTNYKIGHNSKSIQVRDHIFSRPMFSMVRNAIKLYFLFYDHSNYLKLLWVLQIDVSIIYWLYNSVKWLTGRVPNDFFVGIFQKFKLLSRLVAIFSPKFRIKWKEFSSGRVYYTI